MGRRLMFWFCFAAWCTIFRREKKNGSMLCKQPKMTVTHDPLLNRLALACKSTYLHNESGVSKKEKTNRIVKLHLINGHVPPIVQSELSTSGVLVLIYEQKYAVIAHRGTHIGSSSTIEDVKSDVMIGLKAEHHDENFKKRRAQTRKAIGKLMEKKEILRIFLTGHSLGGSTAHYAVATCKFVKSVINQLHVFNAGATPLQMLPPPRNKEETKNRQALTFERCLKDMVFIHQVKGDPISESSRFMTGKFIQYSIGIGDIDKARFDPHSIANFY